CLSGLGHRDKGRQQFPLPPLGKAEFRPMTGYGETAPSWHPAGDPWRRQRLERLRRDLAATADALAVAQAEVAGLLAAVDAHLGAPQSAAEAWQAPAVEAWRRPPAWMPPPAEAPGAVVPPPPWAPPAAEESADPRVAAI